MASLKGVKDRIDSVKSTKKITSAMKMIASSKLRRSQQAITSFLPYSTKLNDILINLLSSDSNLNSPYAQARNVKKVAIVAFTSNSSLCGAFNANILKEVTQTYSDFSKTVGKNNVVLYPIGKKITDLARKNDWTYEQNSNFIEMADKPAFSPVSELSKELISKFLSGNIDQIILIYTHFHSPGVQKVTKSVYLPFDLTSVNNSNFKHVTNQILTSDYILEPSKNELLDQLIPKALSSNLFAALLDSNASEHAARSLAMQIATDNATELVDDLTIEYNKSRQAAITNELLDIIGGAAALSQ